MVLISLFEVKLKGYENVSSNMDYKYADGDDLVFTGEFIQKSLNANKTIWIEREIGKYPVLAFGNSGSDMSMMNYLGRVLDQQFNGDFLKEALRKADKKCHTEDRNIISQVNIHINAVLPEIFPSFRDMKKSIAIM